jgi:ABC-type hemin transport system ATPase subunit
VSAMSRFEWYFKPLRVHSVGQKLTIAGGATLHDDLDIRMLLNSAERTVVGLSWFLALHLLQPPDRRRVLVLDDPAGALDSSNLSGFMATLRAFVRLIRPEQLIVATHDDGMALTLEDELVPVDSWPPAVARVRCQREGEVSVAHAEKPIDEGVELDREEALLGVGAGPAQ